MVVALAALPEVLLVQSMAWLATAANFGRAAMSCTACRDALAQAVRAHSLKRGRPLGSRPRLWLSPLVCIDMPWAFLLRVREVERRVLEALEPDPVCRMRL